MNHIVIACNASGSGGSVPAVAVKHAWELAKYFERLTVVSNSFPDDLPENVERGCVTPMEFNFLRRLCHVPNEYSFVRSVRNYLEALHKTNHIDMIICHSHALAALSAKPLKERYGIPFALVTHGYIFDRPEGTYDRRLTAFYKAVTPVAYRNADLIIALSPYMALCAEKGGANPEVIRIIPNGIDPEDIGLYYENKPAPSIGKTVGNTLQLLFVGSLNILKGVDILISSCGLLKDRGIKYVLKLIGEGPLDQQVKDMVSREDLSQEIHFLGKITRNNLGRYYHNADLVIVPSLSDSLPTVVLEALSAGRPVIGSEVGGIPYMIKNGENGLLVKPADPMALSRAIERLYNNRHELASLSKNAFPSVFPKFLWKTIGESIANSINEVLSRRVKPIARKNN